jgi:LPS sulfotransferase NodH
MAFNHPAIIFCATQRSGSTMVVDDFQNVTGRAVSETEAFYHLAIDKGVQNWSLALEIVERHRAGEAIFFDKVMFPFLPILSRMIAPDSESSTTEPFANFFASAVWVYVRRANIFEQTVSKYTAETLGVWDSVSVSEGFNAEMKFDFSIALDKMRGFIWEDHQWDVFFKKNRITPIQVYYEDAVPNFPHYLAPILAAAGLEMNVSDLRPRRQRKLGNSRSADLAKILQGMVQRDLITMLLRWQSDQNTDHFD